MMPARRIRENAPPPQDPDVAQNGDSPPPNSRIRRPSARNCIRLMSILAIVSILYLFFSARALKAPSEAPRQPVTGQYIRRIVAVGDLHGDYDNALKALQMADVVDMRGSWTANVDYFVQTGDIIDRGDDTIRIYGWMERLREEAHKAGGELFSHLGNHEYMNVLADWRYVSETEIATFGSVAKRQIMLSTGSIGSAWAHNYSVASRVPLHPNAGVPFVDYDTASGNISALTHAALSFMHGGLSPTFAHATPYPSAINNLGSSLLRRCQTRKPQPQPHPPAPYAGLPLGTTVAESALYGPDGPLWYRGWAMDDEHAVCSRVDAVMQKIGVRRLIMGHTPNFEKIVSRCGGKIIIIDTGMSKAYGGVLSALSITYTLTPVLSSFNASTLQAGAQRAFQVPDSSSIGSRNAEVQVRGTGHWIEREEVVAIYPHKRVQLVTDQRQVIGDFW